MHSDEFLLWLQEHRNPLGDYFFFVFTALGDTVAYLLVLPILYWTADRRFFVRVLLLMVAVAALNTALKEFFRLPRPHVIDPRIVSVFHKSEGGLGFPSGHAMSAACFWLYMAWKLRRRWHTALAVAMIVLIGFSRLYLGCHWPADVVGGIAIGIAVAIAALLIDNQTARLESSDRRVAAFVIVTSVAAGLAVASAVQGTPEGFSSAGVLLGLAAGWHWGAHRLFPSASMHRVTKALSCALGIVGVYLLYRMTRKHADAHAVVATLGFISGVWIVRIVPALASRLPQPASHPHAGGGHDDRHADPQQSTTE